jgi:hypothetical protein
MLIMNRNLKIFATLLPILAMGIFVAPGRAGRVEPTPVSCWFFRGDRVELKQTCIYESRSWAGGGVIFLRWEDGVQTKIARGFQERGEKPCGDNNGIDGVCGVTYFRDSTTFKRLSEEESQKLAINHQSRIGCVQVGDKSICWLR